MIKVEHVDGKDKGKIFLYALSTCIWCRKTKELLQDLGVAFDYIYVDLLEGNDRDKTMDDIKKWNPRCSFPTLVLKDEDCITGFKEEGIREALE